MIKCEKCEFEIQPKMRFALVKNFCPSCGSTLLSDETSNQITSISRRLQTQEFIISLLDKLGKDGLQSLVYDISLWVKFELDSEQKITQNTSEEIPAQQKPQSKPRVFKPISRASDSVQKKNEEDEEISSDENEDMDYDGDDDMPLVDDDVNEKVKRLKNLYKNNPILGKFKGISRADES